MADNVLVNGSVIATDDRGGVQHQRVLTAGTTTATYGALNLTTSAAAAVILADGARRSLIIQNTSSVSVYVGASNALTVNNGIVLAPGCGMSTDYTGAIYMIVATGTAAVRYWAESD